MSAFNDFVTRVEQVTGRHGRRQGGEVVLLCPAHDDHHPSLSVKEGAEGRPLVICRSQGCSWEAICEAIGWQSGDRNGSDDEWTPHGPAIATYRYVDERGGLLFEVCRTADKQFPIRRPDPTSKSGWRWKLGDTRRVLYHLPEVVAAVAEKQRVIFVVEGEKQADLLRDRGLVATTNPMGAGKWRSEYADALAGAARVFVLPDDDAAGREHAEDVARSLVDRVGEVRVVKLWQDGETKRDVVNFYAAATSPEEADRELVAMVERTPVYGFEGAKTLVPEAGFEGSEGGAATRGGIGFPRIGNRYPSQHPYPNLSGDGGSVLEAVPVTSPRPFSMPVAEFIAIDRPRAEPLLADVDGRAVVARRSLTLCGALGGHGKTTWFIDLALHLAAGVDYPPFTVPAPASILMIENEGPEELFAEKLAARLASFKHELRGRLDVCTFAWGGFTLAADETRIQLAAEIAGKGYDLVFGDPLDSLGIEGVGSPEDTRRFMALMNETGLNRSAAWWLNTHPRKERTKEALDEIAGAWGGKPDTVLLLRRLEDDRTQVRFPKLRWTKRGTRPPILLAFDADTEAFTFIGEESDEKRDYLREIAEHLRDHPWRTYKEIASPTEEDGIGAAPDTIKQHLDEHPDLFESRTGEEAVALGRRASATLWALRPDVPDDDVSFAELQKANRSLTEQTGSQKHKLSDAIAEARRLRSEGPVQLDVYDCIEDAERDEGGDP